MQSVHRLPFAAKWHNQLLYSTADGPMLGLEAHFGPGVTEAPKQKLLPRLGPPSTPATQQVDADEARCLCSLQGLVHDYCATLEF